MSKSQTNILLIMTDQQRFDSLGCYGCEAVNTPNLDRLAAEGVLFENCVVANPVCTPSRASIWTGKDLPGHGVMRLYDNLHEDEVLFPVHLQQLGYRTGLFGKLHVSSMLAESRGRHPHDGFDAYEWCNEACVYMESDQHAYRKWLEKQNPELCARMLEHKREVKDIPREFHLTHWAAQRTIEFIDESGDHPWFACMSVFDPHNPYDCGPRSYMDRIDGGKIPKAIDTPLEGRPSAHARESHEGYLGDFDEFRNEDIQEMRRGYYSMIELLDDEVGRVLDCLEQKGQLDNTLVIFTSDHGDMMGDHRLLVKGAFFYDACVNVPLLMRWPKKLAEGRRIQTPVQNYDLAATVLEAAGLSAGERSCLLPESRSLLEMLAGKPELARDYVTCRYRNTGIRNGNRYWEPEIHGTMIRDERWKLCYYHSSDEGELYDMHSDPEERCNLWNDPESLKVRTRLKLALEKSVSDAEFQRPPRGGENLPPANMLLSNQLVRN
jgi:arylsulfatase A-like enzyme